VTARGGRRPGESGTREAILTAARESFGSAGYSGTTIRGVARAAAVDPALVHHFFGNKEGLFGAAMELPFDPAVLVDGLLEAGTDGLGERIVRTFLSIWDGTPGQGPMLALLRSAVTDPKAAASLRVFLSRVLLTPLAKAAGGDRPELRAGLIGSQMMGLAVARYVVRLDPVASAGPDELAPAIGANLDRYLTGALD
jgi:AcrR family transcriptional regulator